MARYNHFSKPKYNATRFSELPIGAKFGNGGDTFSTHTKTGELQYINNKTKQQTNLFGSNFVVYIKILHQQCE